jgi:GT2 family glycosyltransferase
MIPVLIVPCLNRWDLGRKMLDSVDVPVSRTVVVDNGQIGMKGHYEVIRPIANLGFSGAINTAIRQTPDAPWWMWASVDLTFGTGDLLNIVHLIEDARGPRVVTGTRDDERLLRFAYAAINREAIEAVGLLDEWTTAPIYYEDDDFQRRSELGGVDWIEYDGAISHQRSATIQEPKASAANAITFPRNLERYVAKWGGRPGQETYRRPYNRPVPLSYVREDLEYRAWALGVWSDAT